MLFFKKNQFCFCFCLSTLVCLIIELYWFIQLAFDGVTLVSRLSHRFSTLAWMGSSWVFTLFLCLVFFVGFFIVIVFFLLKLLKLYKFIKSNQINDLILDFFFFFENVHITLTSFLYDEILYFVSFFIYHHCVFFIIKIIEII